MALAVIYDGGTRTHAAEVGGVSVQTMRDWVLRFNTRGLDGLLDGKAPGQPSILSEEHRQQLSEMIESGPIPAVHGVVRWRLADLMQWLWDEYRIRISKQTLSRELRAQNFRKLSARPRHHAKSDQAVAAFKRLPNASGGDREGQADGRPVEIWLRGLEQADRPALDYHVNRLARVGAPMMIGGT
ncbi:helix-turn-helix domain-containing protein [Microvirga vignae]|uniref:helix-turn-helix domain-containing protein n=1 Tax=Microvirga vignae TaxID=1225564 RepID=UPI00244E832F|nr:winged helix-turn-helix domain-containing protein [Microvirga vignae]